MSQKESSTTTSESLNTRRVMRQQTAHTEVSVYHNIPLGTNVNTTNKYSINYII